MVFKPKSTLQSRDFRHLNPLGSSWGFHSFAQRSPANVRPQRTLRFDPLINLPNQPHSKQEWKGCLGRVGFIENICAEKVSFVGKKEDSFQRAEVFQDGEPTISVKLRDANRHEGW